MKEGEDIQHPWISRAIESAQRKVEGMNFDIRKQLLEYDNVMSKQREVIYDVRNDILNGKDVAQQIEDMIHEEIDAKIDTWAPEKVYPEQWDIASINNWTKTIFNRDMGLASELILSKNRDILRGDLVELIQTAYHDREQELGIDTLRFLERMIMLQIIDNCWKDHLYDLDQLKKGIGWRAYAQKDPVIEFKKESLALFSAMMGRIQAETIAYVFRVRVPSQPTRPRVAAAPSSPAPSEAAVPKKIGRNDPCPCGSGKKYKKCCGK
jgi:preprotein translocase subunit SecA